MRKNTDPAVPESRVFGSIQETFSKEVEKDRVRSRHSGENSDDAGDITIVFMNAGMTWIGIQPICQGSCDLLLARPHFEVRIAPRQRCAKVARVVNE